MDLKIDDQDFTFGNQLKAFSIHDGTREEIPVVDLATESLFTIKVGAQKKGIPYSTLDNAVSKGKVPHVQLCTANRKNIRYVKASDLNAYQPNREMLTRRKTKDPIEDLRSKLKKINTELPSTFVSRFSEEDRVMWPPLEGFSLDSNGFLVALRESRARDATSFLGFLVQFEETSWQLSRRVPEIMEGLNQEGIDHHKLEKALRQADEDFGLTKAEWVLITTADGDKSISDRILERLELFSLMDDLAGAILVAHLDPIVRKMRD